MGNGALIRVLPAGLQADRIREKIVRKNDSLIIFIDKSPQNKTSINYTTSIVLKSSHKFINSNFVFAFLLILSMRPKTHIL